MERLLRAELSSDLGEAEDGQLGDVDILRAAGMAAQNRDISLAIAVWRLVSRGDHRALHAVVDGLWHYARSRALDVEDRHFAHVIDHLMDPTCKHCLGRGAPQLPGAPVLSEEPCPHCAGTGRRPQHFTAAEAMMYGHLERMQSIADHEIACRCR